MKLSELNILVEMDYEYDPFDIPDDKYGVNRTADGDAWMTKKDFIGTMYGSTLPYHDCERLREYLSNKPNDFKVYARMIEDICNDAGLTKDDAQEILDFTGLDVGHHNLK